MQSKLSFWLVGSLLVNALLVGVLIGGGLHQRSAGGPPPAASGEMALVREMDSSLSGEDRRIVRRAMRTAFAETREQRTELRNARQNLVAVLAQEPYDSAAVRDGFARLREADELVKAGLHDALADQFGALTIEQRRAILERFERTDRRHRRHHREGDDTPYPRRQPPPD